MSGKLFGAALFALLVASPVMAQGAPPVGTGAEQARNARAPRTSRTTRELTVGQMAARERQKKCGAEWKDAKVAGSTGGLKWPQFYSKCNARLKGNQA